MRETIFLEIKGMHCPDCPAKVERTLSKLAGVNQVTVDYENENGYVTYNQSLTSIEAITERISGLGFEAKNIQRNAK
ncbi:heavy-metal-associated domain-containing protein [Oceanobacillus alkalisoli]|uniref:heavy-metal-associated domain-containing protein n=1 Tax=Oceanobacillus alkalisoli TaxID=2925113 RepID=UPI001F11F129|nr:heavy metal-associated domain-containing protein [Oceanobacillus alkalisoli]MCF3942666.1 heavy-metal-associated domain-containing protein [Oceanobacillus alkalisoli]